MLYLFDTKIPYYEQIKNDIAREIEEKVYLPGDKLPAELTLAKKYGVSRPTIRQAVLELVHEGLLTRHRGKGTFVTKPIITEKIEGFKAFGQLKGLKWSKLIKSGLIQASNEMAEELLLLDSQKVIEVSYLMGDENEPLIKRTFQIEYTLLPELLDENLKNESIYSILQNQFSITDLTLSFQSVTANEEVSKLLEIQVGTPLTIFKVIIYDDSYKPISRIVTTYRGDRFRFVINEGKIDYFSLNPSKI